MLRDRDMKSTSHAIFTFQLQHGRGELSVGFPLYEQGADARRFHTFIDCCFRTRDRNLLDFLGVIG